MTLIKAVYVMQKFTDICPVTLFFNSAILMSGEWKSAALSLHHSCRSTNCFGLSVFALGITFGYPNVLALEPSTSVHRFHGVVDGDNAHCELADSCIRSFSVGKPRCGARSLHEEKTGATVSGCVLRRVVFLCCVTFHQAQVGCYPGDSLTSARAVVAGIFAMAGAVAMRTNSNANAR